MWITRVRALQTHIAPGLASAYLVGSASCSYVRSSSTTGEAPRAAQPVWRALKSDGVCDCNRWSQNMRAMPNRLHSNDAKNAHRTETHQRACGAHFDTGLHGLRVTLDEAP